MGYNERLDGLQAALLRAKLPHLDGWNAARVARAADYRAALPDGLRLLEERVGGDCVYHLYPVRLADRDRLSVRLLEGGVETGVHYAPALPQQPPFQDPAQGPGAYPSATRWASEELSLPMFPTLGADEVERVAGACARALY